MQKGTVVICPTYSIKSTSDKIVMYVLLFILPRYMRRPTMSVSGLYDPTEVMNMSEMKKNQREGWGKLIYYLVCFFFYLFK